MNSGSCIQLYAIVLTAALLSSLAAVAHVHAANPNCSGDQVALEHVGFSGVRASCVATTSIQTGSGVTLDNQADVLFASPLISLGPGFQVGGGSRFRIAGLPSGTSINSTSQNVDSPTASVSEPAGVVNRNYKVLAVNDLGMHCGDLDTRVSSILPPFNVVHAQVVERGVNPRMLGEEDGMVLRYTGASSVFDPALLVEPSLAADGSVYKTNFWDAVNQGAYDSFYPPVITPLTIPADTGLPMADVPPGADTFMPVVCQRCHYSPALDLAQLGPLGPDSVFPADTDANGREQKVNQSMSRVMHGHHARFTDLFPELPLPTDPLRTQDQEIFPVNGYEQDILQRTCYRCHPGGRTQCLRGAMYNAGIPCQDCHRNMAQVGDDFSRTVSPESPGSFELAADFYDPASSTPRVPWANEPGCGSCHTGDAVSNLAADTDKLAAPDGIRLLQAYRVEQSAGGLVAEAKATPIVPTNKRFAEPAVEAGNPGAENPQLYRISTGHGGIFCEACHGSTHAEWPNANPLANDNVTAESLQGHSGTLAECTVCHSAAAFMS